MTMKYYDEKILEAKRDQTEFNGIARVLVVK